MSDCLFCKIINGEIPSAKVYEDEHVYAFMDISQVTKGHTLLIPKVHKENVFELSPNDAAKLFEAVPKLANAIKTNFKPEGMNIVNNNGKIAGQTVFHYHLHLIPRYGSGDGFGAVWKSNQSEYSMEDLQKMAKDIHNNLP